MQAKYTTELAQVTKTTQHVATVAEQNEKLLNRVEVAKSAVHREWLAETVFSDVEPDELFASAK